MLKALLEKRAKLVADMAAIIEAAEKDNRDLTAEEQVSFDALKTDRDALEKRIANAEYVDDATATLNERRPAVSRGAGPLRVPGPEASREFESFGEFLHSVRFRPGDPRLTFSEATRNDGEMTAEMRMDNDTQGGFMVPPRFVDTMLRVPAQEALVRPRAQVIPAGSPPDQAITMPALDQTGATQPDSMFGGVTVAWIAEGASKPDTNALLRNITLTPHEVAGTMTVTDKLLRNWQAAEAFLRDLLRQAVNGAEDYAFLRGTGVGQPLGAINAGAAYVQSRTTSNLVKYADLVNMVSRLMMRGGVNPVWSMAQSVLPQIATLVDPLGNYIFVQSARDGFAGTLLGYPVRWNNRAPALGTKGDVFLADWSYYLIKDGSGPFVAASEHVLFQSNKTMIKIFWNVDGAPWLTAPIKEENGYEVSPFVVLNA